MKIETLPIEALKPYENNAKIHTPVQIAQISASIEQLGNNDPIEVDENNMVLAGHGRLLALKSLGRTHVDVIRHTGMTEDQKRAYILIHNQLTLNSGWDYNILDAELARIDDIDMTAFDFGTIDVSVDDFGELFKLNDSDAPLVRTISDEPDPGTVRNLESGYQLRSGPRRRREPQRQNERGLQRHHGDCIAVSGRGHSGMIIERVKLSSIRAYEHNAKRHPQSQIDQIAASIQELDYRDPIAVDENGVIIEGHGRYLALLQLGYTEAEVIRLEGLTEEQKRAYILVHNQLTMSTGFDPELLRREIEAIQGIDLAAFDLALPDLAPEPEPEELSAPAGPELVSFVLTLSEDQYQELMEATEIIRTTVSQLHSFGNPNKRNNGIFEVIYQWAERKMLL